MADEIDNEVPATSWAVWAWQAYRDGRLVEKPRALPAVRPTVKVKPLVWELMAGASGPFYSAYDPLYGRVVESPDEDTCDAIDRNRQSSIMSTLDLPPAPTLAEAAGVLRRALQDGLIEKSIVREMYEGGVSNALRRISEGKR